MKIPQVLNLTAQEISLFEMIIKDYSQKNAKKCTMTHALRTLINEKGMFLYNKELESKFGKAK